MADQVTELKEANHLLWTEIETLRGAVKSALKYVNNLNEDTPVDMNCKECIGRVFFDKGTPEPPLCWIHQLEATLDT